MPKKYSLCVIRQIQARVIVDFQISAIYWMSFCIFRTQTVREMCHETNSFRKIEPGQNFQESAQKIPFLLKILAVQDSSISDIVCLSLGRSLGAN